MNDKTFRKIFAVLLAALLALTIAHIIYVICAYREASIIRFIGEEMW